MTSFTEQLKNRRTEDGRWLQGCEHTTLLLNHQIRNRVIVQCVKDIRNSNVDFDI